ncbi:hypothetical protein QOZ80_6BG0502190 [Eleusine coracana subsp. coracana]|nr:hypothetical protein QOZ80_6BG0502190 [Eleusine coracana subsp. coracana]
MSLLLGASASKKRRAGDEAEEDEAAAAEEEDRISALPEELRLRILSLLPLKSAICTGAVSSRWRDLWARRWPDPSSLDLHLFPENTPDQILESLERRGRRRLDRFSLTIHPRNYSSPNLIEYLRRYLDYAVACDVEDLHIYMADYFMSILCSRLYFPPGTYHLARLSICRIGRVSFDISWGGNVFFSALEVIHLRSVRFVDLDNLLSSCPRLRTLDLRYCEGVRGTIECRHHLKSVTVAECNNVNKIHADRASGLRSFRLSSASFPTYDIPVTAPLQDLYISLRGPYPRKPLSYWIRALPHLANLTALTICSVALRRVYALARFGSPACLTKLRNLPNLKELQLLMFEMDSTNLAHIYVFFRTCRCPQLERLFVQLPKNSHDTSEDISLEMAEENEPDEELSEEEEPHEELCEEEETGEELSKEYETEEELLEDEILEEYMLKDDRLFYEDMHEEDPIDEDISEQSEDDLPEYGLTNLVLAKMMKFKGDYFELRLVSFLLRKATGLKKLLLVAPQGNHMEEFGEDQMDTSRFLETKLSRLERASSNAEIIVNESDHAEIQPLHSDVFAKF